MDGEKIKENINHTYSGRVAAKAANQTIAPVVFPVGGKIVAFATYFTRQSLYCGGKLQ